jgi:hypothetical protein
VNHCLSRIHLYVSLIHFDTHFQPRYNMYNRVVAHDWLHAAQILEYVTQSKLIVDFHK